ncbi:MFS family permease [Allocatelliglobosispora scoriae]|uniref:MFS family permease n=1 Tax=Allocatelliglobosispora scoriae TaxID=643052 RepID=A0A841BUR9_9ACTN|nr:MFS transporter [Allocatelliglobosispora scoriae]MBB5871198.1 MFS family permease [Allocatelliglobosispora scoriae]
MIPDRGLPRSLALQSLLFSLGSGMFLTGSAVYFTEVVGLTAIQIGIGFSIAGGLSLLFSVPMGALVDRVGAQRSWMLGALAEGAVFAVYPLVKGFTGFLVALSFIAVAQVFAQAGRGAYTIAVIPPEIRVRTQAFMRSALNVGFTVGAGMSAIVLAFHSHSVLNILVISNAIGLVVNGLFVSRLPKAPPIERAPLVDGRKPSRIAVFRDRPILALTGLLGAAMLYGTVFAEVIPLWIINRTEVPKPVIGALFTINTIMAVLLQVPASRGADSMPGAIRLMRWGALATMAACPLVLFTSGGSGWLTIGVLAVCVALVTMTELWVSSAMWYLFSEIPPPDRRGEYLGAMRMGGAAQAMVGPAALTFLALHTGWGWWLIGGVFGLVALVAGPLMWWAANSPRPGVPVIPVVAAATPTPTLR